MRGIWGKAEGRSERDEGQEAGGGEELLGHGRAGFLKHERMSALLLDCFWLSA